MSKFTFLVLCVVAASISKTYASEEDKAAIREYIKPIIDECSKEHGVSNDDIESAKAAANAESIKPCFLGCVYKKAEVFNAKGEYDVDNALLKLKKFVPDEAKYAKFTEIGKKCASVNDKTVSDGEAGCERGALLTACFLENRGQASEEEKAAFRETAKPIVMECSKEHGISVVELKTAKEAGSVEGSNPCFLGCVYKKAEVINGKGEFDLDKALIQLKQFVSNEDDFAKFADIGKKCASVTEKPVSDGETGCNRAALLPDCFLEHRSEIPI